MKKRGFTLLEILVTIAIIAILASMLIAGLTKARHKAIRIVCINNLKQIGYATGMYAGDYANMPSTGGSGKDGLALLRSVYQAGDTLFLCPGSGNTPPSIDYFFADELTGNSATDSPLAADDSPRHDFPMIYTILFIDGHVTSLQTAPSGAPGDAPVD